MKSVTENDLFLSYSNFVPRDSDEMKYFDGFRHPT